MERNEVIGLTWSSELEAAYKILLNLREAEYPRGPIQHAASSVLASVRDKPDERIIDVVERMMQDDYIAHLGPDVLCERVVRAVEILRGPDPAAALRNADGPLG